jgi:hypothetical protein
VARDIEFKTFPTGDPKAYTQVIGTPHEAVDPETGKPVGVVEALVAVTGVVDEVGDVFVPGSFRRTIGEIKAKGVSAHDWKTPVSKALEREEWLPGDPRLPKDLPNGDPWPSEAGAVYVKALHNLRTEAGRTAYENALFYGREQNYSVGYKVRPGGAVKKGGVRYIRDHDWYEWSDVLHGANKFAHLLSVKADLTGEIERTGYKLPDLDIEEVEESEEPEHTGGMIALVPSERDLERIGALGADAEPREDLHLTLLYLGDDVDRWPSGAGDRLVALLSAAAPGMAPVKARVMGHGLFNPDGGEDGTMNPCAVYLVGDSPEIDKTRRWLLSVLSDGDDYVTPPEQHDPMIPHITAGYGVPVDSLTYTGPVTFDRVRVALAGDYTDVPLGDSRLGMLDDEYKSIMAEIEAKDIHSGSVGTTTGPASMRPAGKMKRCKFCANNATTRLTRDGKVLPVPVCAGHKNGEGKSVPVNEGGDLLATEARMAGLLARVETKTSSENVPGYEGSAGPFSDEEYRRPHVYARDVMSGAGNCVCGADPRDEVHTEVAPGVPVPGREVKVMSPDPRAAKLREYWAHGAGRRKWKPGVPGDFKRLRRQLAKYISNPKVLNGLTANIHKLATGEWPGRRAHGGKTLSPEELEPTDVEDLEPMDEALVEGVDEFAAPYADEDTAGYEFDEDSLFARDDDLSDVETEEDAPEDAEADTGGDISGVEIEEDVPEDVPTGDDAPSEEDGAVDVEVDTEEDENDEDIAAREQRLAVQEGKAAVLTAADLAEFRTLFEAKAVPEGALDELTLNLERLALAEDTLVTPDEVDEDTWNEVVARDRAYRLNGGAELEVDALAEQRQNSRSKDGNQVPAVTDEVPLFDSA